MSDVYVGIDYSLTSPATAVIVEDKVYVHAYTTPKKVGITTEKNWEITLEEYPVYSCEQERHKLLALRTLEFIEQYTYNPLIRIEGYSYGSSGKVFNLAENCGQLKQLIFEEGLIDRLSIISPSTLKKYANGKGNANKILMYESFVEQTGMNLKEIIGDKSKEEKVGSPTSDIVDAWFIARSLIDGVEC